MPSNSFTPDLGKSFWTSISILFLKKYFLKHNVLPYSVYLRMAVTNPYLHMALQACYSLEIQNISYEVVGESVPSYTGFYLAIQDCTL
jgi:hypothetical protein